MDREKSILRSLCIIFRAIRAQAKLVEKNTGMNSTQLWMLWEIANAPGMKVTQLANILSIHQTTCSNLLDKIEEKGLIRRDRTGPDQRVVHLNLTEKGADLLKLAPQPAQGVVVSVLQQMSPEDLKNLDDNLGRLVDALHVPVKDAEMKPLDINP